MKKSLDGLPKCFYIAYVVLGDITRDILGATVDPHIPATTHGGVI